jgi:hypothetical protein
MALEILEKWQLLPSLLGLLQGLCLLIAAPVGWGGYFLVWGDNGPPPWAKGVAVHVIFGLCFYGLLGAIAGTMFYRKRSA